MVDGKFKVKNEMSKKMGEHAGKLTVTNKDYTYEHKYTPESLNKDGMQSSLVAEGKMMPAANNWEGKAEFKIGGVDLGGAQAWTELQLDSNKKKEHVFTYSQNMKMENYHMGWKLAYGANAAKLTQADGFIAGLCPNGKYAMYLRAAGLQRFVGVGMGYPTDTFGKQAFEIQYDFLKKTKGLFGMPLFLRWGTQMKLENGSSFNTQLALDSKVQHKRKLEVPVSSNLKLTFSDSYNLMAVFKDMSKVDYKFGFAAEFKC